MLSKIPIRKKILWSTIALTASLIILMYCSLNGIYAYRDLLKSIGALSSEVQEVWRLSSQINDLSETLTGAKSFRTGSALADSPDDEIRQQFRIDLAMILRDMDLHHERIERHVIASDPLLATSQSELETIESIKKSLQAIDKEPYELSTQQLAVMLVSIEQECDQLFDFLTSRMYGLRAEMRTQYHWWIGVIIVSAVTSLTIVGISFWFFRHSVVQPFKVLLNDCRKIAGGKFDHQIGVHSQDELGELAQAMNSMTDRFLAIRNNLNEKVQLRTREVVRSEQLASVGFLAAGVAHEINNPLASIAWSAEALESRLHEVIHLTGNSEVEASLGAFDDEEIGVLRKYLRRIQDEAFRCKGITERLLDFSRLGESQEKQETDVNEAVTDVIALVKHLGQYRNRSIRYHGTPGVRAFVSETEFKQVVLNLLTNALDASQDGDEVAVTLEHLQSTFQLTVVDQGCGMTEEVQKHLFEPFFTRRRDGKGTGLGLSITYRIVQDHMGSLKPYSAGPGKGSTLTLEMPLNSVRSDDYERFEAA